MNSLREFWGSSPPEQKDYLFIYAWGALWALVYATATPTATVTAFSTTLVWLWTTVTVIGAALGIYGLVTRDNLLVERFGVHLLMIGPIAYSLTQLGLSIAATIVDLGDPIARVHLVFFALWPYLFLNKRRRQLKARVKLVKKIPLAHEAD
jgi:hypothetical protein